MADVDYGYGDDNPYGYGDDAPTTPMQASPRRKAQRRGSVTKFSLEAANQVAVATETPTIRRRELLMRSRSDSRMNVVRDESPPRTSVVVKGGGSIPSLNVTNVVRLIIVVAGKDIE